MRLATFLALGAIVGVDLGTPPKDPRLRTKQQKTQNQRQMKQCVNKDWNYPGRGGRLTQIVNHLSKLCKGYIDRPTYQCRCLQKQKTLFWNLMKSRRVCLGRKRKHERKQAKKENKNQSRKRRDEEDDEEDISDFDEVGDIINAAAGALLATETDLANELDAGGELTDSDMDDLVHEQCDATDENDADAVEECTDLQQAAEDLRSAKSDEAKERAEIIYRIIRMHKAMANWAETYIADGPYCDKQSKMVKRTVKNRRRMQKKRKAYPTNPSKLKRKKQEERAKEQAKKEKAEARAAANE